MKKKIKLKRQREQSVNINTDILVEESGQREGNKKSSDYVMTKVKINLWLQDETFQFWDTIDGKPSKTSKKYHVYQLTLFIKLTLFMFICWVCEKYPKIKNTKNKVANGCSLWLRIMTRHDSNHQVRSKFF